MPDRLMTWIDLSVGEVVYNIGEMGLDFSLF